MRRNDEGDVMMAVKLDEQAHQVIRRAAVEIGGGFVGEYQVGLRDDGAGDRDALLLAAGKLGRSAVFEALETDLGKNGARLASALLRVYPLHLHHELDVFLRAQYRNQVVGLEYEADMVQANVGECAPIELIDTNFAEPDFTAIG